MRSLFAVLRSLTLPAGSGPTSPRIIIGPASDLPADLNAFYAAGSYTLVGGFALFDSAGDYVFVVEVTSNTGAAVLAVGTRNSFGVSEMFEVYPMLGAANSSMLFGQFTGPANNITIQNGVNLTVTGTSGGGQKSQLLMGSNGLLTIGGAAATPGLLDIVATGAFNIDTLSAPRGFRDAMVSNNGTLATSAGPGFAETAVPAASWDQETTFNFIDGRLYRCSVNTAVINSAATATIAILRVRKGSASTTGTQLMYWEYESAAGFLGAGNQSDHFGYIKNTSGSDVSTKLSLTIDQAAGAGNMSIFGDAIRPVIVAIEDIGKATEQPGIASMAISV